MSRDLPTGPTGLRQTWTAVVENFQGRLEKNDLLLSRTVSDFQSCSNKLGKILEQSAIKPDVKKSVSLICQKLEDYDAFSRSFEAFKELGGHGLDMSFLWGLIYLSVRVYIHRHILKIYLMGQC